MKTKRIVVKIEMDENNLITQMNIIKNHIDNTEYCMSGVDKPLTVHETSLYIMEYLEQETKVLHIPTR